jgi:tetratricopeptide (TPR) repeat protein
VFSVLLSLVLVAASSNANEAFKLFEQSEKLYREGKFREAAALLERAYTLDPEPTLLFNRARALESAGDLQDAVDAYALYLHKNPKAPDRLTVERRIETMKGQIAERAELARLREEQAKRREELELAAQKKVEPAPPPLVVTEPVAVERTSMNPAPWVLVGVGVAGVIAGSVFGLVASGKNSSAEEEPVQTTAAELAGDAKTFQTGANVAYVSGGVVAAGGLVWALLAD